MQDGTKPQDWQRLRAVAVASGLAAAVLFPLVGLATQLQMFGDGSIFSYAVAAREAWAFHWHNISGRVLTYLYAYVIPEQVVALSGSARAGIALYGALFFSAPLIGLLLTFAADRSPGRMIFNYACLSTALLCPFVYGAPTEMWMAHALFWPVLALCLFAPMNARGGAAVAVTLCALVLTHGGAIVLTLSILFALFLRGGWDRRFMRACIAFGIAMLIWIALRFIFPPDDYFAPVLHTAAFKFIDVRNLAQPAVLTIVVTLAGYACLIPVLRTAGIARPHFPAVLACIAALAVFWIGFDRWVLSEARYDVRTALLIGIPILGLFATLQTMSTKNWLRSPLSFVRRWHETVLRSARPSALIGALTLVVIVHVYETGKFVLDWTQYKAAVRALATSTASDPQLGSPLFVSSDRIASDLDRLEWNSTTPFLSVLVTPSLTPTRLVVDPAAGYFWLSCRTARESEAASTAIPEPARRLIRLHACLHRPD